MIIKSKAKALVSVLLSSAMILSLVGCKSNEEPVAEKPTVEVKTEEPFLLKKGSSVILR